MSSSVIHIKAASFEDLTYMLPHNNAANKFYLETEVSACQNDLKKQSDIYTIKCHKIKENLSQGLALELNKNANPQTRRNIQETFNSRLRQSIDQVRYEKKQNEEFLNKKIISLCSQAQLCDQIIQTYYKALTILAPNGEISWNTVYTLDLKNAVQFLNKLADVSFNFGCINKFIRENVRPAIQATVYYPHDSHESLKDFAEQRKTVYSYLQNEEIICALYLLILWLSRNINAFHTQVCNSPRTNSHSNHYPQKTLSD